MKIAAIYDIHGNLPALEAVLKEIDATGVDEIIVGGDVLPGPMPRECLDMLRKIRVPLSAIHGNGEHAVLDMIAGREPTSIPKAVHPLIEWTAARLDENQQSWIATWPMTLSRKVEAFGKVLFCHATPHNDTDIFSRETAEENLRPVFDNVDASLIVCGHTHMQFDRTVGSKRVVNAGSVGMPFGDAGAYWLLLDNKVIHKRTEYDLDEAARIIRDSDYPQAEQFAANHVLTRPTEETILAVYKNAELK